MPEVVSLPALVVLAALAALSIARRGVGPWLAPITRAGEGHHGRPDQAGGGHGHGHGHWHGHGHGHGH